MSSTDSSVAAKDDITLSDEMGSDLHVDASWTQARVTKMEHLGGDDMFSPEPIIIKDFRVINSPLPPTPVSNPPPSTNPFYNTWSDQLGGYPRGIVVLIQRAN